MAAGLVLLVAVGGCGDPSPSDSPGPPALPIGCFGVPLDPCMTIGQAAAASARTAGLAPVYVSVRLWACAAEPCAPGFGIGSRARAFVEVAAAEPRIVEAEVGASGLEVAPVEAELGWFEARPRTTPVGGPGPFSLSLGHCGVDSGIDFDGSLWDPVGSVDHNASDAINAADGTIHLTSPTTAAFSTLSGFRLDLVRHPGSKFLPLCM